MQFLRHFSAIFKNFLTRYYEDKMIWQQTMHIILYNYTQMTRLYDTIVYHWVFYAHHAFEIWRIFDIFLLKFMGQSAKVKIDKDIDVQHGPSA